MANREVKRYENALLCSVFLYIWVAQLAKAIKSKLKFLGFSCTARL